MPGGSVQQNLASPRLPSTAWVELSVHALEPFGIDVGVPLGRGDARVAEHLLHVPQVHAAGDEVGREAVAEGVGADVGGTPALRAWSVTISQIRIRDSRLPRDESIAHGGMLLALVA